MSKDEFSRRLTRIMDMPPTAMKEVAESSTNGNDALIAKIFHDAFVDGDERKAEWLYSRLLGKPSQETEPEDSEREWKQELLSALPADKLSTLLREALLEAKEKTGGG